MAEGEGNVRFAEEVPRLLREVTEVCVPVFERRLSKIVCGTIDGLLVDFDWSSMRNAAVLDQYNSLNLLTADGGAAVFGGLEHFMWRLKDSCDLNLADLFLEVQVVALPATATLHQKKIEYLPDGQLLRYSLPLRMGRAACCSSSQFERLALRIGETDGKEALSVDGFSVAEQEEEYPAGPPNSRHSSRPCAVSDCEDDSDSDVEVPPTIAEWKCSRDDLLTAAPELLNASQSEPPAAPLSRSAPESPASPPVSAPSAVSPPASVPPASERTPLVMNANTKLETSNTRESSCCGLL